MCKKVKPICKRKFDLYFDSLQPLSCPPAMKIITTNRNGKSQRFLLRGDSEGYVTLWNVPDITIEEVKQIQDRNTIKSMSKMSIFLKNLMIFVLI